MTGQLSIFAFCFQVRELVFLQKPMMNEESNVLPCPKRAFSDVLGAWSQNFFPQGSLKNVETFLLDNCFSIDHLHRKGIKFIAIEKGSKQLRFISFEFTCLTRQLET